MNGIQSAIANIAGVKEQLDTYEKDQAEVVRVMEALVSDNALLQRQIEDIDYLNLFEMNQVVDILPLGDRKRMLQKLRRLRHDNPIAKQAVNLIIRFTLGRGVQWVLTSEKPDNEPPAPELAPADQQPNRNILPIKFLPTPGETKAATPPSATIAAKNSVQDVQNPDNDPIRDIIKAFWNDDDNKLAFTSHKAMQVMLDEIVTDGEKFYVCFESDVEPYLKVSEVPIEEISDIIYDADNRLRPVYYKRHYVEMVYDGTAEIYKPKGNPKTTYYLDYRITDEMLTDIKKSIRIPAGKINEAKMRHVMINEVQTKRGKRGVSELFASRDWFRVFREFMEGRAAINAAAQAISYIRKIKGGPSTVASFSGKFGGLPVGEAAGDELGKLTRPAKGAVYDVNQGVDVDWMKTDTGAANAKEDAKLLLMAAGAGVGTMAHYFGEGGDANLATAQSMELPMVKSYENWQQFIDEFFRGWIEYVLTIANDKESAQDEIDRVGFTFPPIIMQDIVKLTTAWAQIVRDIAPNNMAVKRQAMRGVLSVMGVPNIDGLMPEIEAEMAHAEAMRIQQQNDLMSSLNNPANPNDPNQKPPVAGRNPNQGMPPDLKRIASGKPAAERNGPKSA